MQASKFNTERPVKHLDIQVKMIFSETVPMNAQLNFSELNNGGCASPFCSHQWGLQPVFIDPVLICVWETPVQLSPSSPLSHTFTQYPDWGATTRLCSKPATQAGTERGQIYTKQKMLGRFGNYFYKVFYSINPKYFRSFYFSHL